MATRKVSHRGFTHRQPRPPLPYCEMCELHCRRSENLGRLDSKTRIPAGFLGSDVLHNSSPVRCDLGFVQWRGPEHALGAFVIIYELWLSWNYCSDSRDKSGSVECRTKTNTRAKPFSLARVARQPIQSSALDYRFIFVCALGLFFYQRHRLEESGCVCFLFVQCVCGPPGFQVDNRSRSDAATG